MLNRADEARIQKAQADFKAIETALKIYRLDNYVYPTTEQGLEALVEPSSLDPEPRNFKAGGYLQQVPLDPWGRPYLYRSPGEHGQYDLYTLGADNAEGGDGDDDFEYNINAPVSINGGLVTSLRRDERSVLKVILTDAAINPGNSGGALINTEGEIVGINSLIYTETGNFNGIGFAIPIDLVSDVVRQITENGYVIRGWLGVEGQNVPLQTLKSLDLPIQGVLITGVDEGGPGSKAGLEVGDIITHINQEEIRDTADVLDMIAAGRPGDNFRIDGIRERQSFSVDAVLGQRPMRSL